MRRTLISVLIAVGSGLELTYGRTSQDVPQAFRGATHTVSIYATVADTDRRLVPDLTKDDFVVYDNGKRQALTVFENTVQPISVVMMLDRSSSMLANFDLVRDAAGKFIGDLLPADRARIGSFSHHVQIDPPGFTNDRDELTRILEQNLQEPGPTPLWNAALAAISALGEQGGRRVVLLFTDGKDQPEEAGQNATLNEVIRRAQADDIMVYAIGLGESCAPPAAKHDAGPAMRFQRRGGGGGPGGGGRGGPGRGGAGRGRGGQGGRNGPVPHGGRIGGGPGVDVFGGGSRGGDGDTRRGGSESVDSPCRPAGPDPGLKLLADDGGGGYFELRATDNLGVTLARVAEELHRQYTLGFRASALDGKVHTLDVRVNHSNMTVRARKTYLASRDQ